MSNRLQSNRLQSTRVQSTRLQPVNLSNSLLVLLSSHFVNKQKLDFENLGVISVTATHDDALHHPAPP